ncbi:hypothetical protein ALO41_200254 [Pseudomonas amygdali pv. ulmi]|uniref:Transcriptional regulator, Cro/CI family n=1 Tax=Pseudomonas amygdali pv. ulmi TaxID=251720 RepID=A0A0Q0F531_PSEA0|nr:lysozyme inhibitor LprI family protein [Pseudomonas amygdali]KPZ17807.1 hypothetical protein ALO41_200254 [Pseudomonas amygdali pv. ulmi]KWS11050.1 hypothetical protein AL065_06080 [Pseudomonas amygdali pv. ulmi]
MRNTLIALAVMACANVVQAASSLDDCLKLAKTTNDSELCVAADSAVTDARLRKTFEYVVTHEEVAEAVKSLRDAQLAWDKFRDLDCSAVSASYTGTYRCSGLQSKWSRPAIIAFFDRD